MKKEIFKAHLKDLIIHLRHKYPLKKLVIQLDNATPHLGNLVNKLMEMNKDVILLYGPAVSPEFSAIENLFADLKRRFQGYKHQTFLKTAEKITSILFGYN